jgi:hypothetical protein
MSDVRYPIVVLALALAILGTGCGGQSSAPQAAASTTQAKVSSATPPAATSQPTAVTAPTATAPAITVQGSQGQSVTVSGAVPDALKSFPVPDGFNLTNGGSGSVTANGGSVAVAEWSGAGTAQAIGDFYARTLQQQGWSQQFSVNSPTGASAAYAKGDSQATITIDTSDSKTTKISVALGQNLATAVAGAAAQIAPTSPNNISTNAQSGASQSVSTNTPAPVQLTTGGSIPAALSSLPVPNGFTPVSDSTANLSSGNQLNMATASWTGSSSVADAAAFYKKSMPAAGWTEVSFMSADTGFVGTYTSAKDPKESVVITGSKADSGTKIVAVLNTAAQ